MSTTSHDSLLQYLHILPIVTTGFFHLDLVWFLFEPLSPVMSLMHTFYREAWKRMLFQDAKNSGWPWRKPMSKSIIMLFCCIKPTHDSVSHLCLGIYIQDWLCLSRKKKALLHVISKKAISVLCLIKNWSSFA